MSFEYLVCPFATNHVGIETAFHEEKFASTPSVMTTSNFHQLKEGQAQQDLLMYLNSNLNINPRYVIPTHVYYT